MKVKLRTQYSGPKGSFSAGAIVDFDQAEAYGLVEGGYAEQVDDPAAVEAAVLPAQETTEAPANKRRKR